MARYRYIEDEDELKASIEEIIRRIHDEADPHEMNEYKRFLKRNVSIFSRAYFTAFLLKQLAEGDSPRPRKKNRSQSGRRGAASNNGSSSFSSGNNDNNNGFDQGGPEDRTDGDQQTLFVSIGKNRRVFPKDFVALITNLEGVNGDQIGQIKILDSYSFVEVNSDIADKVIEAYNGYEYRGRKLTVNYARSKKN